MKSLLILVVSSVALAGCERCDTKFVPSQFVKQRLSGERGIVIRQSDIENLEGYCLVTVRMQSGALENLAVEELEASQ